MIKDPALFNVNDVQFVMLSFEGPDLFSLAGGLGIRATELCKCLGRMGYGVHLYFIGDPEKPSSEIQDSVCLHRWCQWISALNPGGCYMAEYEKVQDMAASLPEALIGEVIAPGVERGATTVIMAEEWQTIPTVMNLRKALRKHGLERRAIILWNANNLYGFSEVNWKELEEACVITAVSRYMKHRMWMSGINPVVIHNGIPKHIINSVDKSDAAELRRIFPDLLLTKVGRYDVDKRWVMAIRSVGVMKLMGMRPTLIARGGKEYHRHEVLEEAARQNLSVKEIHLPAKAPKEQVFAELERCKDFDILELCFYVSEEFINILYGGSDCVLANSGHEPFGLVGLEVMACGGLAFVGATGEDYAQTMVNSVVIETENELEIVEYIRTLMKDEGLQKKIRQAGKYTASHFTWDTIALDLMQKVRFLATTNGVLIG